jgi:cytochrome c-type biogenesis protein CcmH/NrfF
VRRALIAGLAGLALAAPAAGAQEPAGSPEPRADLADIADEVMCTVCGVPLDHALEAPQAEAQRQFIRRLIAQGRTKEEIKGALVAEYGEDVLAVPGDEGFDLVAWVVPGVALASAILVVALALRRWRRGPDANAPASADTSPDEAGAERLEADMARYEL